MHLNVFSPIRLYCSLRNIGSERIFEIMVLFIANLNLKLLTSSWPRSVFNIRYHGDLVRLQESYLCDTLWKLLFILESSDILTEKTLTLIKCHFNIALLSVDLSLFLEVSSHVLSRASSVWLQVTSVLVMGPSAWMNNRKLCFLSLSDSTVCACPLIESMSS